MKSNDSFNICMETLKGKTRVVSFEVVRVYKSEIVERYRLTGGKKILEVEKRLNEKRQPWKLISMNFRIDDIDIWTIRTLHHIWDLIDEKTTGKRISPYRSPEERSSQL